MSLVMDIAEYFRNSIRESENNNKVGYGMQKECEDFVNHIMKNMISSKIPPLISEKKNGKEFHRYLNEGNEHFVNDDDVSALEKHTKSLAYANTKQTTALAHASRSAVLFRQKHYRECIADIDAALSFENPDSKDKWIRRRRKAAIDFLKKEVFPVTENDLSKEASCSTASNTSGSSQMGSILPIKVEPCKPKEPEEKIDEAKLLEKKSPYPKPDYLSDKIMLANGPSKESPVLSQGIKISYSKQFGRHMIATDFFKPGDVLSIEEPFSYMIYRDRFYTHCHHCLSISYNLIPCPKCPLALYCSKECRDLAWILAHSIECPVHCVLTTLQNVDNGKMRILTNIIRLLIISTKKGTRIDELRRDSKVAETNPDIRTAGFTDNGQFVSGSARCAFSLATNLSSRSVDDVYAFGTISALAIIILGIKTEFFGSKFELSQLSDFADLPFVKFCGGILFRASVIVTSNTFSIQQDQNVKSGGGLYTVHSLYNHSCCANTFRLFDGLKLIIRALEPIVPGDQIYTCYGSGYQVMSLPERQKQLKTDFFFDCCCTACIEDWPTYGEILKNHVGSIAKTNKELVKKMKPLKKRLLMNHYDIDAVTEVLMILYNATKMPCEEIIHGIQYLKKYYFGKM